MTTTTAPRTLLELLRDPWGDFERLSVGLGDGFSYTRYQHCASEVSVYLRSDGIVAVHGRGWVATFTETRTPMPVILAAVQAAILNPES